MGFDTDRGRHAAGPVPQLVIDVARSGRDRIVVTASGELCAFSAPAVACRLRPTVLAAREVVLDLRQVSFFSAAGARVLVELRRWADERGVRIVVAPSAPVRRVLALARLESLFAVVDQVDPPAPDGDVDLREHVVPTVASAHGGAPTPTAAGGTT